MLIASAPLRVSLLGGGSDYPEHFESNCGSVFGFAIKSRTYVSALKINPILAGHAFKLSYRKIEEVPDINSIEHSPFRKVLEMFSLEEGWEFGVNADLPAYTGLGSSSSFLVALIALLKTINEEPLDAKELALLAFSVERDTLGQKVGLQDQVFAAFGKTGAVNFGPKRTFEFQEIDKANIGFIERDCLLVSTGTKRKAASIVEEISKNASANTHHLSRLAELANFAFLSASKNTLEADYLAELMNEGWTLKKKLASQTSNSHVEEQIEVLKSNGALGLKLLGAGGGGFIFVVLPPGMKDSFRRSLSQMHMLDISVENEGVRLITT